MKFHALWALRDFMRFPREMHALFLLHNFLIRFPYESSCFLLHNVLIIFHAFEPLRDFLTRFHAFLQNFLMLNFLMRFHSFGLLRDFFMRCRALWALRGFMRFSYELWCKVMVCWSVREIVLMFYCCSQTQCLTVQVDSTATSPHGMFALLPIWPICSWVRSVR
jgi:signal transduction histidine kinase